MHEITAWNESTDLWVFPELEDLVRAKGVTYGRLSELAALGDVNEAIPFRVEQRGRQGDLLWTGDSIKIASKSFVEVLRRTNATGYKTFPISIDDAELADQYLGLAVIPGDGDLQPRRRDAASWTFKIRDRVLDALIDAGAANFERVYPVTATRKIEAWHGGNDLWLVPLLDELPKEGEGPVDRKFVAFVAEGNWDEAVPLKVHQRGRRGDLLWTGSAIKVASKRLVTVLREANATGFDTFPIRIDDPVLTDLYIGLAVYPGTGDLQRAHDIWPSSTFRISNRVLEELTVKDITDFEIV